MKQQEHARIRKRKALLLMPLLVIPFLTLAFWALGGGKAAEGGKGERVEGVNVTLPGPQLEDDRQRTKLHFYEMEQRVGKAAGDSVDPSAIAKWDQEAHQSGRADFGGGSALYNPLPPGLMASGEPAEVKVYQKLHALNKALSHSASPAPDAKQRAVRSSAEKTIMPSEEVDRLEALMSVMHSKKGPDQELLQMDSMMSKILDIQHPERVRQRIREAGAGEKPVPLAVHPSARHASLSLLDTSEVPHRDAAVNGFWGLTKPFVHGHANVLEAAVYQNQTLVEGAVLTLRLLTEVQVQGQRLPKGTLVSGTCQLNGERLEVLISGIRLGSLLLPVQLEAFDLDGIRGLYIPGAITRDAVKSSLGNATGGLELGTLDPSFKGRVADAGMGAVKNLLRQKARLVKVTVKAGYRVLLKEK